MCKVEHGDTTCGHAAHLECDLRSYMDNILGEMIAINDECMCRHCDEMTGLISHANKLL
jgi:hypothetical protein